METSYVTSKDKTLLHLYRYTNEKTPTLILQFAHGWGNTRGGIKIFLTTYRKEGFLFLRMITAGTEKQLRKMAYWSL